MNKFYSVFVENKYYYDFMALYNSWKYYENKSQKILAQELGLQPSKVCKVLKTAIKNIRKQFQIHLKTR